MCRAEVVHDIMRFFTWFGRRRQESGSQFPYIESIAICGHADTPFSAPTWEFLSDLSLEEIRAQMKSYSKQETADIHIMYESLNDLNLYDGTRAR